MDLFSSAPFVSHDAPDSDGVRAEVMVNTGYGPIRNVEEVGKSRKVSFKFGNMKYETIGYIHKDSPLVKKLEELQESQTPIFYRIEIHRKNSVDRSLPIAELRDTAEKARENCHKTMAGFRLSEDDEWTLSDAALTNPGEDPSRGGANSANKYSVEELRAMSNKNVPVSQGQDNDAPRHSGGVTPHGYSSDVLMNLYLFVSNNTRNSSLNVDHETKRELAEMMFSICNWIQVKIYRGKMKKADIGSRSHTVARKAVFEVIESDFPITEEVVNDEKARKEWGKNVTKNALELWVWSYNGALDFTKSEG